MDDPARLAYGAWPERMVIVEDGVVKYYGDRKYFSHCSFPGGLHLILHECMRAEGPWGYKPEEVMTWLANRFPDVEPPAKL